MAMLHLNTQFANKVLTDYCEQHEGVEPHKGLLQIGMHVAISHSLSSLFSLVPFSCFLSAIDARYTVP
jgi:hypothetical protein